MKDLLNKTSDLSRTSLQDLKKTLAILRLVSLMEAMEGLNEDGSMEIEIPLFGKILISKDFDFEFIPDSGLKKDAYNIRQEPDNFLKAELKKLLKIGDTNNG